MSSTSASSASSAAAKNNTEEIKKLEKEKDAEAKILMEYTSWGDHAYGQGHSTVVANGNPKIQAKVDAAKKKYDELVDKIEKLKGGKSSRRNSRRNNRRNNRRNSRRNTRATRRH
jgi:hypothetical protein